MLPHEIDAANAIMADQLIEITGLNDPSWGDPAGWPEWTDRDIWNPGPEPEPLPEPPAPEPESFEPSEEDRADQARWSDRLDDHLAWLRHLGEQPDTHPTDQDIQAAGLAVG
jgi:hypothetical protein